MGRKKSVQRIPKSAMLKCPHCSQRTRAIVDVDNCPQKYTCPKCNQEVRNPLTSCCVICAFSNKKCPRTLLAQARVKGWELR
jgi:predicted nucleic acid-binding Zn ribbon protein